MKICLFFVAFVALLGPLAVWAAQGAAPSNGLMLLAATDGAADAVAERERMRQRIDQLRRIQRQPAPAPYGTGFEARKELSQESANPPLNRDEWPQWMERTQRPRGPGRQNGGGAGRGRR